MTLAVVAAMANSPTTIRNVGSWRVKETERMKAIVTELGKLGVEVFSLFSHLISTRVHSEKGDASLWLRE